MHGQVLMRELIRYKTGEYRVIDTATMTASGFLHHNELNLPLEDFELDYDLDPADIEGEK